MPELWLVQYLCPTRHCIVASPYERPTQTPEGIEEALLAEMTRLQFNPWCGICGSRELRFEHSKLAEQDWDKAWAQLRSSETEQILSRIRLELARGDTN